MMTVSINTGDNLDSMHLTASEHHGILWHAACMLYIAQAYIAIVSMGLRQPREYIKLGQWYLSENVALSL